MVKRKVGGARRRCQREIRRIENEDARQVCFSKRRKGLFKKASELATLCGAEIAILVNSPAGRPYTFGSPSVDPVVNRFLSNNSNQPDYSSSNLSGSNTNQNPNQDGIRNRLNQQYNDFTSRLDAARFRRSVLVNRLERAAKATPECNWSENIEQLGLDQLKQLLETLCQTKARLVARQNDLIHVGAASSSQVASYHDQISGMMMAGTSFPNAMLPPNQTACQGEPRMVDFIKHSVNPNPRLGLNLNLTPVPSPMRGFSPRTNGESGAFVAGPSSNSEEHVPSSIGGFSTNGYKRNTELFINPDGMAAFLLNSGKNNSPIQSNCSSQKYPTNPVAVNLGSVSFNSFFFAGKEANVEAGKRSDFEAFTPLEPFGSVSQRRSFPVTGGTSDRIFGALDLISQNQAYPGPIGSITNGSLRPSENEPERNEEEPESASAEPRSK